MSTIKLKKYILAALPYVIFGLLCTNLGEAWRLSAVTDAPSRLLGFMAAISPAFVNPAPSFHPVDLTIGFLCGCALKLAVYLKGQNAKNYRHGIEYGSARWGTAADIAPFIDPIFENNVILSQTERLMMSSRPKNPADARKAE